MQLHVHTLKCFDDCVWMQRWLGGERYVYLSASILICFCAHVLVFSYSHACILSCLNANMFKCPHTHMLGWSHLPLLTCLDDQMLPCTHALRISCLRAHLLWWSYVSILVCHDDCMLQCLHASILTCLILKHMCTHLDYDMSIWLEG